MTKKQYYDLVNKRRGLKQLLEEALENQIKNHSDARDNFIQYVMQQYNTVQGRIAAYEESNHEQKRV